MHFQNFTKDLRDRSKKMKKHTFQENYEKIFGSIKEGWWDDMSDEAQQKYIDKHGSAPGVVQRNTVGGGDPSVTPHDPGEPEADVAGGDEDEPDYSPGHPDNMDDDELEQWLRQQDAEEDEGNVKTV